MGHSSFLADYDKWMVHPLHAAFFNHSDFYNYGYSTNETDSQEQACINLVERLLAFIPARNGTILDVACGLGASTRHLLNYYEPADVTAINLSDSQLERASRTPLGVGSSIWMQRDWSSRMRPSTTSSASSQRSTSRPASAFSKKLYAFSSQAAASSCRTSLAGSPEGQIRTTSAVRPTTRRCCRGLALMSLRCRTQQRSARAGARAGSGGGRSRPAKREPWRSLTMFQRGSPATSTPPTCGGASDATSSPQPQKHHGRAGGNDGGRQLGAAGNRRCR